MEDDSEYQTLITASFRFLSYRPHSEKELRDFLQKKLHKRHVYGPALIEKVIERLKELEYVNDIKFAEWWVSQRQGRKPKALSLIIRELMSKGITQEIIEQLLPSDIKEDKDMAIKAIEKKVIQWQALPVLERKRKIYGYLGRRGFSGSVIHSVVDDVIK